MQQVDEYFDQSAGLLGKNGLKVDVDTVWGLSGKYLLLKYIIGLQKSVNRWLILHFDSA